MKSEKKVFLLDRVGNKKDLSNNYIVVNDDISELLDAMIAHNYKYDLLLTSPPYNLGKSYETKIDFETYINNFKPIVKKLVDRLQPGGSLCWQVGNFIDKQVVYPLDIYFHPLFVELGLHLRNRIIWRFGHGLHAKSRFSGRYETILWYTKTDTEDKYHFDLDSVRIPSKYPGKKYYKGPRKGQFSSNPLGKNPEDVWDIPNVNSNHMEKTIHPCQFPVALAERLILALAPKNSLIFDPFSGVSSTGVAAAIHGRRFIGCEVLRKYCTVSKKRIEEALCGKSNYRPHDLPIYDHNKSKLSIKPEK